MRRSGHLVKKQAKVEKEAQTQPNAKKNQSNDKLTTVTTLDNSTMVEVFQHLNYCQLANNSLVSKRFRNLIQTHRHKLALLSVSYIGMDSYPIALSAMRIFNKELSHVAYNEWLIRNNYSKQVPLEEQVATTQSTQKIPKVYQLSASAYYNDASNRDEEDKTTVFHARVKFNDDNWPVFQHFIRLVSDPFVYIECIELTDQKDVLNLLAEAFISDYDRLQCNKLIIDLRGNSQKSIAWTKTRMRCNKFCIIGEPVLNEDEAFFDFFVTGAHCTPSMKINFRDLSKAVINFVQKFMDLKNSDETHLVEAIKGNFGHQAVEFFKRDYAENIVKEERRHRSNTHTFEFVNNHIGKKMHLTAENHDYLMPDFSIKINNL